MKNTEKTVGYGYYSKLLGQPFDTLDELKAAEDEYNKLHAAQEKAKAERAEEAAEVKKAAEAYLDLVKRHKAIRDAQRESEEEYRAKFVALRDNFAKKHNGYHLTITQNGDNVEVKVDEVRTRAISNWYEDQIRSIKDIFDSFGF